MARLSFSSFREPVGDVARVILARLGRDAEIGTKKGGAQFGDQLLGRRNLHRPSACARICGPCARDAASSGRYADIGIRVIMT
jgi:hypothetical protein